MLFVKGWLNIVFDIQKMLAPPTFIGYLCFQLVSNWFLLLCFRPIWIIVAIQTYRGSWSQKQSLVSLSETELDLGQYQVILNTNQPICHVSMKLFVLRNMRNLKKNWCESWTVKKAERPRIDAFELWCWRRLLRVPWTARRSNQSILKEINPGISLEGMMLKLKL